MKNEDEKLQAIFLMKEIKISVNKAFTFPDFSKFSSLYI